MAFAPMGVLEQAAIAASPSPVPSLTPQARMPSGRTPNAKRPITPDTVDVSNTSDRVLNLVDMTAGFNNPSKLQARDTALEYAGHYRIPESRIHVELGSIEKTILDKADDIGADLIVVGSHTRSGLALLLGSTARGLVPGAHCDVLAVKMDKRKKD